MNAKISISVFVQNVIIGWNVLPVRGMQQRFVNVITKEVVNGMP